MNHSPEERCHWHFCQKWFKEERMLYLSSWCDGKLFKIFYVTTYDDDNTSCIQFTFRKCKGCALNYFLFYCKICILLFTTLFGWMIQINILLCLSSTTVEQVVACALVTQRARVRSPVGTGFLGEVFSGFFLTCKTNVGKRWAPKVPEYHLAVEFIISYSLCWDDWVCAWCVSSFMFVLSRRWPRHWADHSSGEVLHVLVWSKKYVCDP